MSARPCLPWLAPVVEQALSMDRAHAVLLHAAAGDGLFDAARAVTQAWLCRAVAGGARLACGHCNACQQYSRNLHPDLHLLVPEDQRAALGLLPAAGASAEGSDHAEGADTDGGDASGKSKRKPSRQIRVGEVRAAIDWIVTSSSHGGAKVVLVHPAEALNVQAANALLKTLEEPPRGARLLLTASQPDQLLPTVRSRCQVLRLRPPAAEQARAWLLEQGLTQPDVLLAASSQRPLDARDMALAGIDATRWAAVPAAALTCQPQAFAGWGLNQVLSALYKLCHDGMALAVGAPPRFYPASSLTRPTSIAALAAWSKVLARRARHIEHPLNEGLLLEVLLLEAQAAWAGSARPSDTLAA